MRDNSGRLVALPLCRGGEFCAIHAKPFVARPANPETSLVIVYLDLETTGGDVAQDRIVELAASHAPADHRLAGGNYSTTVRVDPQILKERGTEAAAVHGISDAEIAQGPNFVEAWTRFLLWTEALLNTSIQEDVWDSDDDEPRAPRLEETPVLLLAAHNGARASVCLTYLCERVDRVRAHMPKLSRFKARFDFPLLLCEVMRHDLSCAPFERWLFVDTLAALHSVHRHACMKLQCLSLRIMADTGRAHRALDDCVSLRQVVAAAALVLGVSASTFLKHFAQEVDLPSSRAQISVLMDPGK